MRLREWISAGAGITAVGVAILAVGSAPRWAQAVVAALVAVAMICSTGSRRVPGRVPPLVVMLGIAAGLTMVQLLPLGKSIVGWLNPTGAELRADGAAIAGVNPRDTLTFDVPGSLSSLAFFLTVLGVAIVSLRIATSERGRFALLAVVAGFCGVTAAVVGLHTVVGAHSLYGLYEPLHVTPRLMAPLLNMNQLGCLMALGAVVAGSLVMYTRQSAKSRVAWLIVALSCAVVSVTTLSRGATIALACGTVVLVASLLGQRVVRNTARGQHGSFATSSLPIVIVAVCAVVMVVYASSGGVQRQLESTSLSEVSNPRSKFAAWRSAEQLISESPWTGWGRGAFEPAFTRVHQASGQATFAYLENEYIQTVVDFGIPGAALIVLAGGWFAWVALRRWRGGPLAAGGLAGLSVVALQSNVDFGVELLGLAVPATIVAATLTYVPLREARPRTVAFARGLRIAHALAILVGAAVLLTPATKSVAEDHDDLPEAVTLVAADLHDAIARHPLDYRGYLLEAVVRVRDRDPQAIAALNHALVLHPTHSGLHLLAAELLRKSGNLDQAAIEYASALRSSTNLPRLLGQIVERMPNARIVAQSIPPDDPRFNQILHTLEELHRPDIAIEWLERVLVLRSDKLQTCAALYSMASRTRQMNVIAMATQNCPQYRPSTQVTRALAKTALQNHDDEAVIRMLGDVESWTGSVEDKLDAWLILCDAHMHLGHFDDAERCLHRLDATGYATHRQVIQQHLDNVNSARILRDNVQPSPRPVKP
jgi:O-antigen ligase/tetratricopeptide (TPR) repeat protein